MKRNFAHLFIATTAILTSATVAVAQWSSIPACNVQHEKDRTVCNGISGSAAKANCWATANERLAYCVKTKGEIGTPFLKTK